MSDTTEKTYVFPAESGSGSLCSGLISALAQRQGIDPAMLLAMRRDGVGDGDFLFILLFMMMYWQSSLDDERHLALYVKDVMTDVDAPPGAVYARWAAMSGDGAPWDAD